MQQTLVTLTRRRLFLFSLVPLIPLLIEFSTSGSRGFTLQQFHTQVRWIGILTAIVAMAIYIIFIRSFRDRLSTQQRVVLFIIAFVAAGCWSTFYIYADPANSYVLAFSTLITYLAFAFAFVSSLGFIAVLASYVDRKTR